MGNLEQAPRRRRGPKQVASDEKRTHCASVRLNSVELATFNERRGKMRLGEFLRRAATANLPPTIPEINREAWVQLAKAASNLNQIAAKLNRGGSLNIPEIQAALQVFRLRLLGVERSPAQ